jgi:hypothetical protein
MPNMPPACPDRILTARSAVEGPASPRHHRRAATQQERPALLHHHPSISLSDLGAGPDRAVIPA